MRYIIQAWVLWSKRMTVTSGLRCAGTMMGSAASTATATMAALTSNLPQKSLLFPLVPRLVMNSISFLIESFLFCHDNFHHQFVKQHHNFIVDIRQFKFGADVLQIRTWSGKYDNEGKCHGGGVLEDSNNDIRICTLDHGVVIGSFLAKFGNEGYRWTGCFNSDSHLEGPSIHYYSNDSIDIITYTNDDSPTCTSGGWCTILPIILYIFVLELITNDDVIILVAATDPALIAILAAWKGKAMS
jgi:hypothetical protein